MVPETFVFSSLNQLTRLVVHEYFIISVIYFFSWTWAGSSTQAWLPTYVSILRIPQMIWVWRATVEWYWQGKTEKVGEKPVPVPLCPPQTPHGLTRGRTRASALRGRRLTTWAMARPVICVSRIFLTGAWFFKQGYVAIETVSVLYIRTENITIGKHSNLTASVV
jgi:hypothetical protein